MLSASGTRRQGMAGFFYLVNEGLFFVQERSLASMLHRYFISSLVIEGTDPRKEARAEYEKLRWQENTALLR